jgi:asparagine synthase (glutamine-hydrolysing)
MVGSRHPCWLSYNGEVYNFAELRRELQALGHDFRSRADSEVVLRAYEAWGVDAIRRFRGMFSFGLWDERLASMILARDPFGIKPLYYYSMGNVLIFASEVRALLATGLIRRKLDRGGLASFFSWGSVAAPLTIIEGLRSLLPGRYLALTCHQGRLLTEEVSYAENLFSGAGTSSTVGRTEAGAQLREVLEESIRLHLVSDVPLGVFLSGGIDSTAITALMSRVATGKPRTFCVALGADSSDARYARLVAERFGTDHQEISLSESKLFELLPMAFTAMDQPTIDGINTFVISKAVKEVGVTVALSGLGADELFAGYPSFRRAQDLKLVAAIPRSLRRVVVAAGSAVLRSSVSQRKFWELMASDASATVAYAISRRLFSDEEIRKALGGQTEQSQGALEDLNEDDRVNSVSRSELRGYMANTLLRDTDCMSMAHGLEVRVPFVDSAVVKHVLALPGHWKLGRRRPKRLLLEALGELLPAEVWGRRKEGFTFPFERWLRAAFASRLDAMLSERSTFSSLDIDLEFPRRLWDMFKKAPGRERWSRPWAFYVLTTWCERNQVQT